MAGGAATVGTEAGATRRRAAADKEIEVYGYRLPAGTSQLAIELQAYRDGIGEAEGGLGPERHFRNAWKLMWPKFQWNEWAEIMVWAWCNFKYIACIGHQRGGKTYTFSHCVYLDYYANPFETLTSLTTVTFEGLKLRMWSDLLTAIETSSQPNPFLVRSTTNEMRVVPRQEIMDIGRSGERFQIEGIATAKTQDAPGRIKGKHAPRRRIGIDEAEDVPDAIYDVLPNPMSAPDAKAFFLCNPIEKISRMGSMCEPENGWGSVQDSDLHWLTRGGVCLHFDGLQSPNLKAGRTIFPYLLSVESVEDVKRRHGEESVQWWSLVRGWFPPDGLVSRIFPSSVILKGREPILFDFPPRGVASLDPAFEQDDCVLHLGQAGRIRGGALAINATETRVLKTVVSASAEPKDYQIAHQVMAICRENGVAPDHFIMDRSGGGRGVYAILQKEWSPDIEGIDYGGAATERILVHGETQMCCDIYKWFVTELWFRARVFVERGLLGGLRNLHRLTEDDLNSRRYDVRKETKGTVQVAETKVEVKKRLGRSPDYGDSFVQFAELLVRLGGLPGAGPQWFEERLRWSRQKERVRKLNARHDEAKEYSHF